MILGGGTTLAFTNTGAAKAITASIVSVGETQISIPMVERVLLAGGAIVKLVGDTIDYGSFPFTAYFDSQKDMVNITTIAEETTTITFPDTSAIAGEAAINQLSLPGAAVNQVHSECQATWTASTNPPTFTKYTPA